VSGVHFPPQKKGRPVKRDIELKVNGQQYGVTVDTRETLLDVVRYRLGFTGSKEGCGNGNCGSCTVKLDEAAVNSCLVFAVEADGCKVTTIEGIGTNGKLHPLQKALIDYGALQCGFCTPGFVVAAASLLQQNSKPTAQQVRLALAGNLCRCTGYDKIVRAVLAAAQSTAGATSSCDVRRG
jgi:carbon-monoxide dehydrogenase small subunit